MKQLGFNNLNLDIHFATETGYGIEGAKKQFIAVIAEKDRQSFLDELEVKETLALDAWAILPTSPALWIYWYRSY